MTVTTFSTSVWSTGTDPVYSFAEDGDEVRVLAGVTLHSRGDAVIDGRSGFQDLVATIDGTVLGRGWSAIFAFDSTLHVTVGATGAIRGGAYGVAALEASGDSSLVNRGEVVAPSGFGVSFTASAEPTVENHGTIRGLDGGLAFSSYGLEGTSAVLYNTGTIAGGAGSGAVSGWGEGTGVYSNTGLTSITNLGTITSDDARGAALSLEGGVADVVNEGRIEATRGVGLAADLRSDAWNAFVLLNSGTISGAAGGVVLGAEGDRVVNTGMIVGDVTLGAGNDSYLGDGGRLDGALRGGPGDDVLVAGLGNDSVYGGLGNDFLSGGAGNDRLDGGVGSDTVSYEVNTTPVRIDLAAGQASFPGTSWLAETLVSIENAIGGSGNDVLVGDEGRNALMGLAGDDTLSGGGNVDQLYGGDGADVFRFTSVAAADGDRILSESGFVAFEGPGTAAGDRIDLSAIDANTTLPGHQSWTFGTGQGPGHVWAVEGGPFTWIRGSTDDDPDAEFEIGIRDYAVAASAYTADDFIL